MTPLHQTVYDILYHAIDLSGLFLDAALIVFLADHYFKIRTPELKKHPLLFYLVSFSVLCIFLYFTGFSREFFWFVFSIFAAVFGYSCLLFRGSAVMKLSISCIYGSVYFMMDGIYLSLYRYVTSSLEEIPDAVALSIVFFQRILCKIFMYFIIRFLLKNATDIDDSIPPRVLCMSSCLLRV